MYWTVDPVVLVLFLVCAYMYDLTLIYSGFIKKDGNYLHDETQK